MLAVLPEDQTDGENRQAKDQEAEHRVVLLDGRFREVRFLKMLKSMMPEDFKRTQILILDYAATLHCLTGKKPVSVIHGVTAGKAAERWKSAFGHVPIDINEKSSMMKFESNSQQIQHFCK